MEYHKHLIRFAVALILLVGLLVFVPVVPGKAFVGGPSYSGPLLGGVTSTFFCPCSLNTKLTVGGPVGGTFMLTSSSKIFATGGVSSGDWVLGTASGFATCWVPFKWWCIPIGGGPVVQIIGSS